ncbi:hypothetical protein IE077_004527 [Cardiosporidium cionae]|uniref:Uncharacterized protein n=1 Tax=Cardiosporidium cionae TaxID=476202 RepID=A0ABQ7JFB5_9APIC|nr:hypothetical protein IE077_004527 [Cardiosporidium cionae]|eukprot:KAF8822569.1 hypothetical protein IE077_004527 [Cardiosporidium cionae]
MALSPAPAKLAELPSFPVESEDAPAEAHSRELNLYGTLHQRPSSHSYGGTQMLLHPSVGSQGRANSMGTPAEIEAAQVALYGGSAVAYQSGTAPTHSRVPVYMQSPGQLHATHSFPRGGMFPGVMNPMFVAPPGTIAPQMVNISSQSGVNSLLPSQVRAPMPMRYSTVPGNHDSSEFMLQGRMSTSEESSRSAMYAAGQVENNPPGAPPRYAPRYNSMVSSPYYAMGGDPRSPPTSGGYYATNASNHGHPSMDSASASALKGYYEGLAQSAARRHPSMMSVPPYPMPDPSIYSRSTGSYYAPIASPSLPYPFPPNFLSNAPVLPPGQSAVPALVTVVDGQAYAQILSMDSQTVPMNPTTGPTLPLSMLPMGTAQNIAELSRGAYNSSVYPPVAGVIPFSPSDPRYSQYMQVDPRHAYMYGKGVPIGEETVDTAVEHLNGIKPKVTVKEYAVEKSLFITQHDLKTNTMARREISLIFIHKNPSVYYMENFLTPEECQHMIDLCSGRLVPSKTSKGLESDVQV